MNATIDLAALSGSSALWVGTQRVIVVQHQSQALSEAEGSVLSEAEGPVLSPAEGTITFHLTTGAHLRHWHRAERRNHLSPA